MDNNIVPNLQQLSLYNQLVSKYLDSDEIFKRELMKTLFGLMVELSN